MAMEIVPEGSREGGGGQDIGRTPLTAERLMDLVGQAKGILSDRELQIISESIQQSTTNEQLDAARDMFLTMVQNKGSMSDRELQMGMQEGPMPTDPDPLGLRRNNSTYDADMAGMLNAAGSVSDEELRRLNPQMFGPMSDRELQMMGGGMGMNTNNMQNYVMDRAKQIRGQMELPRQPIGALAGLRT